MGSWAFAVAPWSALLVAMLASAGAVVAASPTLVEDLVLGLDPEVPLGKIFDVALDSQGNIYVLDGGFDVVRKYTPDGIWRADLGGKGEGPGMFYAPSCLAVGRGDRLYVAGQSSFITILTADGKPAGQIKRAQTSRVQSIAVDTGGDIYTVSLDPSSHQVIHVYDGVSHERIRSFCASYASGTDVEPQAEQAFAGGSLAIGEDGLVYYVQRAPQEVRVFAPSGELLATHAARADETTPPPKLEYGQKTVTYRAPRAVSGRIIVLENGTFLTSLLSVSDDPEERHVLVDLYDARGTRLWTLTRLGFVPRCRDAQGRIYVSEERDDVPVVIRYRFE